MNPGEFLIRVRPTPDGQYVASIRQMAGTHPEARAGIGPISLGHGATVPAAMVSAVASHHLAEMSVTASATVIAEVPRYGC
jgi:hypothetical protein